MKRPLAIDLYCGLGGWSEGLIAAGFRVVGFDVERHRYPKLRLPHEGSAGFKQEGARYTLGEGRPKGAGFNVANEAMFARALAEGFTEWQEYPGQLVLQDVLTLHGSQFKDAALIVASPPCTEFSYMAMPWKRAKRIAAALRGEGDFPDGYRGSRTRAELTALFDACFRIREEASAAAGRRIPLVVENVRGAQPWVGRAEWAYGSYYLWGDVPALMPITAKRASKWRELPEGLNGHDDPRRGRTGSSWCERPVEGVKVGGLDWSKHGQPGYAQGPGRCFRDSAIKHGGSWRDDPASPGRQGGLTRGVKQPGISGPRANGKGDRWFQDGAAQHASRSPKRKAASALIAKIPKRLALHIGEVFFPKECPR